MIKRICSLVSFLILSNLLMGQLVINEVLYDPSTFIGEGDANRDGVISQQDDEFIELYNTTNRNLDISGYKIYNNENWAVRHPNHEVPAGTILPPGGVLVVFGGGTPTGDFGGAIIQTASFGELDMGLHQYSDKKVKSYANHVSISSV